MVQRLLLALPIVALLSLTSGTARADVPPPDTSSCSNKTEGAACTTDEGESGACKPKEGSQITYLPDGGHGSAKSIVLTCIEPGAADADGGASDGGTGSGSSSKSGCSVGSADLGSGAALLALIVPFALGRRRKRAGK